ncbi:nucleotidyltransferase family protein [Oceanobacillus saliphilus]|uniref:nucleotidyltransferase family protein n=1 Tax=Oceanobacillus saliphilus TaxID=2925834 RepID=UPI00201D6637|nr:nucleotidyltransferase family protein [Oceanobacillus saliphilus]
MKLENEEDIIQQIKNDAWMMEILKTARTLELPDWWICAGFVRSKIWDELHGGDKRTEMADIDVVYFDKRNTDESAEKRLENILIELLPNVPWSVKNEARMHLRNNVDPYISTIDAIAKFPETATALGVKLDETGELCLTAPHGVQDVLDLVVRPTPLFKSSNKLMENYLKRIQDKKWHEKWNKVTYSD